MIQAVSPSMIGGARCRCQLRRVLLFFDAFVLNKPEVRIGGVTTKIDAASGVVTEATNREFLASDSIPSTLVSWV